MITTTICNNNNNMILFCMSNNQQTVLLLSVFFNRKNCCCRLFLSSNVNDICVDWKHHFKCHNYHRRWKVTLFLLVHKAVRLSLCVRAVILFRRRMLNCQSCWCDSDTSVVLRGKWCRICKRELEMRALCPRLFIRSPVWRLHQWACVVSTRSVMLRAETQSNPGHSVSVSHH